ncbi:hypothetical protein RhiirB3_442468 [Rhizophagus irregularis]|nr:hypothetical protein RhiirB3_442468 [Rhizophagus irregularis]
MCINGYESLAKYAETPNRTTTMGFGWAEVSDKFLPPIIYNGGTVFYPSSY